MCVCVYWSNTHLRQLYNNCAALIQLIKISKYFTVDITTFQCLDRIFICSWLHFPLSSNIYIYFSLILNYKSSFLTREFYIVLHAIPSLHVLYFRLPEQFLSMTVKCADLFTPMCIKFSYRVFHYTFLQILTQLQHLQYCVFKKAVTE
jgi:hypothetical protein